jgi:hypothetical protein
MGIDPVSAAAMTHVRQQERATDAPVRLASQTVL